MADFDHEIEKHIAKATIKAILGAGYQISVNDGEETTVDRSVDAAEIFAAMFSTDEDFLLVHRNKSPQQFGWVRFIYGNCGWEVINDYTTNLEEVLAPVNAMAEKLSDGDFSSMLKPPILDRKVTGYDGDHTCTVREFIAGNADGFSAMDVLTFLSEIEDQGYSLFGGGAAPAIHVRMAEG